MHTYTAEEVASATRGWPEDLFEVPIEYLRTDPDMSHVMALTAIGGGLVWLAERKVTVSLESVGRNWWVREHLYDHDGGFALAPIVVPSCATPLAAVSAAVRWVMEQDKKEAGW
jgi:hypothetical protein